MAMIRAYHDQIPAISAGETLDRATSAALGAGTMKPKDSQALVRRLERLAQGEERQKKEAAAGPNPAMLAAMGIALEVTDG